MELLYWLSEGGDSEDREHLTLVLKDESKHPQRNKIHAIRISKRSFCLLVPCYHMEYAGEIQNKIQLSVNDISRGLFNLNVEDVEQSSMQEV